MFIQFNRHKGFLKDCPDGLLTEQVNLNQFTLKFFQIYVYLYLCVLRLRHRDILFITSQIVCSPQIYVFAYLDANYKLILIRRPLTLLVLTVRF